MVKAVSTEDLDALMNELVETNRYSGDVRPWREVPETEPPDDDDDEDGDGDKQLSYREKLTLLLGGVGSGNFGHSGRPGEVGGSAPGDGESGGEKPSTAGTTGVKFRKPPSEADTEWLRKNSPLTPEEVTAIADKKDGSKLVIQKTAVPDEIQDHVFGSHDIVEIAGRMVEDMPGDVRVSWGVQKNWPDDPGATVMTVYVRGAGIQMARAFIRHEDGTLSVYHDVFEIPTKLQGQGIAKAVLADSMNTYRELGVDKVGLLANMDRGGYAWAKFGFKATRPGTLAAVLTDNLMGRKDDVLPDKDPLPDLTPSQRVSIKTLIETHKDDPKLPWHIANTVTKDGREIGKELLYEASWFATMDLNDKEAMAKFNDYVKGH